MNKITKIFISCISLLSFTLCGCGKNNSSNSQSDNMSQQKEIYRLYVNAGGVLSYEEWLNSIKGADGCIILTGIENPTQSQGNNGDVFINTLTWDLFTKNGGSWIKIGNIMGPQGEQGPQGQPGINGHTPTITISEDGYWVVDGVKTSTLAQGPQGVSVINVYIDDNGDLIVVLSNGQLLNAGHVKDSPKYYTITFNSRGGSTVESQSVEKGNLVSRPVDPIREGFEFVYWVDEENSCWDFSHFTVNKDLTLYAVWDEIEPPTTTLSLRNLYFSSWDGSDKYTDLIEEMFDVEIQPQSYDYSSWNEQVVGQVNGNNITDVFHFDLEPYNFGMTYKKWAEGGIIKALPDELSEWPNLKTVIEQTSSLNSLKINGKIYGLPISYNKDDMGKDFSTYTYVYRRDWLKALDPSLVHDDDTYTWEEFLNIIDLFGTRSDVMSGDSSAIGDASWGFPSLANFYSDTNRSYAIRNNQVVNSFTTDEYISGLLKTKELTLNNLYFDQISHMYDTKAYDNYKGGHMGIYYENLSLSNYSNLRKDIKEISPTISESDLEDRTAIMKVKGPDGKFHLEESENWFSMTFLNADMSDQKMYKILDILDYLLSDEGTKLAVYGEENVDYIVNDGAVQLVEENWPKKANGEYATKINGAKCLRNMITLGQDTASYDPYTNQASYAILNSWQQEMKSAEQNNNLVRFGEPANVKWLSTDLKDRNASTLISEGLDNALKFAFGYNNMTSSEYVALFATGKWMSTLSEINTALYNIDPIFNFYSTYDLNKRGDSLVNELQNLCFDKHTTYVKYNQVNSYFIKSSTRNSVEAIEDGSNKNQWFYTGKEASGYGTREHVWPCSSSNGIWVHNTDAGSHNVDGTNYIGAGSDLLHVRTCDSRLNIARGNARFVDFDDAEFDDYRSEVLAYGETSGKWNLKIQGYSTNSNGNPEYSSRCEPDDNMKGDIARIILYVWVHYTERGNTPVGGVEEDMTGTLSLTNVMGYSTVERCIEVLKQWNKMDLPSDIEKLRNNTVQQIQGNRNPFVDYPELVDEIFD